MNKKIIYISIFLIGALINLYNFTDVFGDTAIPKFRPFGTSTTFADSTNYVTLNKGLYARDSIKTDKDAIIKGAVRLDTLGQVSIQLSGLDFQLINNKENGGLSFWIGEKNSVIYWYKSSGGSALQLMQLDTINGLTLNGYNFQTSSTGQIKLPSDTASDYDSDDAVTINRQSGIITTKSLTTALGGNYTITVTNSLCLTTSRVFAQIGAYGGAGTPVIYIVDPASGSFAITLANVSGASLNASMTISFTIFN